MSAADQTTTARGTARRIAFASSLIVASIALLVLAGWMYQIDGLKSLVGAVTMKPNMAAALIACAVAVALLLSDWPVLRPIVMALALLPGAVGVLTLSQHLVGWNLGIDELLFREAPGAAATASPGRIGLHGSVSLMLASLALFGLNRNTAASVRRAQILAALMALFALVALTGYAYGTRELYDIAQYTVIAFPTAFCLLALSVGLLLARANAGPVMAFAAGGPGGVMARRMLVPAVAVPLVLGYASMLGQESGLYDAGLGTALLAVALVAIFVAAIARTGLILTETDAQRRETERALQVSERSFSEMFRSLPVAAAVARMSDGVTVDANDAFMALTGYTRDEVLGTTNAELRLNRDENGRQRLLDSVEEEGLVQDAEIRWFPKTGAPRDVVVNLSTIELQGTKHVLSTIADITERKRAEEALRRTMEVAEAANRVKDQFLATLSHELRTPLNAIIGYARMLRTGAVPEGKHSHALEIIERNAAVQNQLIEDLLDISRMTTGRLRLEMQRVPVVGPLQEAIDGVRPTADAKDVELEIIVDPLAGEVSADPARLQQVFWNLLSNAVKFTDPGGRVGITLAAEPDGIRVTVRDTGIGISPAFLPYVFDAFRQADAGFSREHGGLGLGLAICKQLVDLHAGSLTAASDGPGRGAAFTLRLPRQARSSAAGDALETSRSPAELRPQPSLSVTPAPERLAGMEILVVDDHEDSLELLRHLLQDAGAAVRTASDASEALRQFDERRPDLLIADLGLPQMDGCELLRQIRNGPDQKHHGHVPAVAVTAYSQSDDRRRAQSAGFQAHIPKPIDPESFLATVIAATEQRG